jgi:heptosyltransferase-3
MKSLLRFKKPFKPKKILIIATRQIGDTLITSPLITKTHETWPHAKIDFLGFTESISILNGHSYINELIGTSKRPNKSEYWNLLKRLYQNYDLALITQPTDRAHLFGLISAKKRYGIVDKSFLTS